MAPIEPWQNSTPFFGAADFFTIDIDDLNTSDPAIYHSVLFVTQLIKLNNSDLTKTQFQHVYSV